MLTLPSRSYFRNTPLGTRCPLKVWQRDQCSKVIFDPHTHSFCAVPESEHSLRLTQKPQNCLLLNGPWMPDTVLSSSWADCCGVVNFWGSRNSHWGWEEAAHRNLQPKGLRPYTPPPGNTCPIWIHIDLTSILKAHCLPSTVLGLKEVTLNRLHVVSSHGTLQKTGR